MPTPYPRRDPRKKKQLWEKRTMLDFGAGADVVVVVLVV